MHFGAQYHSQSGRPVHSSSLPFCVRFNEPVTKHAATLDTEPLAKSYPGGSRTHLSINHFQFAPDPHVRWCGSRELKLPATRLSDALVWSKTVSNLSGRIHSTFGEFRRRLHCNGDATTEQSDNLVTLMPRQSVVIIRQLDRF